METQIRESEDMFTNFMEIRVYGLMRSGNHAIIEWIQDQYSGQITCFLNNVAHGNCDPYKNYKQRILTGIDEQIDTETLRKLKKRLLIYSYEDREHLETADIDFVSSVFQQDFEENRKFYLGNSHHQLDLAIIRDPFNCLASRLRLLQERGALGGVSDLGLVAHNWKILAKDVLTLNKCPRPGKTVVNYNRWVVDQSYRRNLSQFLMGELNDSSIDRISGFGGGSSFQETHIEKLTLHTLISRRHKLLDIRRFARIGHYWKRLTASKPKKTAFFERWKLVSEDENYRRLFHDNEIIELSEELFGEIPGTRKFVKAVTAN